MIHLPAKFLRLLAFLALALPATSPAQEEKPENPTPESQDEAKPDPDANPAEKPLPPHLPPQKPSLTEGSVTIDGTEIPYQATAATVILRNDEGKPTAHVFHVTYVKKGVEDTSTRPVTFCFNGGPGSSAVWLHLGGLGPKKVVLPDDGIAPPKPPGRLADNPLSILDATDLVFVDPVSTGFSRSQKPDTAAEFHGIVEDVHSLGDFVRRWITENRRWDSPKFLLGESYGGLRVAALSDHLQDRFGIYLNGTILVSAVLDFATLSSHPGNDLPFIGFLPSLAATAHYHKALKPAPADLATLRKSVESFARDEYAPALLLGSHLPEDKKREIAGKIASFTGLDPDFVLRSNLRVSPGTFSKEILRTKGKVVGRFDSRVLGDDPRDSGDHVSYDPSFANIYGTFASTMQGYVGKVLKFESDLVYEILSSKVQPWDYSEFENRYVNVSSMLADALQKNPHLHVLALCGYYDLATPYFAMEHSLSHLPIDPELRANLSLQYYDSGHMMYNNLPDHIKLRKDLIEFIAKALK